MLLPLSNTSSDQAFARSHAAQGWCLGYAFLDCISAFAHCRFPIGKFCRFKSCCLKMAFHPWTICFSRSWFDCGPQAIEHHWFWWEFSDAPLFLGQLVRWWQYRHAGYRSCSFLPIDQTSWEWRGPPPLEGKCRFQYSLPWCVVALWHLR